MSFLPLFLVLFSLILLFPSVSAVTKIKINGPAANQYAYNNNHNSPSPSPSPNAAPPPNFYSQPSASRIPSSSLSPPARFPYTNYPLTASLWSPLFHDCFTARSQNYLYTICPFRNVTQKGLSSTVHMNLGVFESWRIGESVDTESGEPELQQEYAFGNPCSNGKQRRTRVTFKCALRSGGTGRDSSFHSEPNDKNGLQVRFLSDWTGFESPHYLVENSVGEPAVCEYAMEFRTAAACGPEARHEIMGQMIQSSSESVKAASQDQDDPLQQRMREKLDFRRCLDESIRHSSDSLDVNALSDNCSPFMRPKQYPTMENNQQQTENK